MNTEILYDRIRGGLYGAYIGDTFGATTEFMTKDEIRNKYGLLEDIVGGGWLNLEPGDPTDDTEMSLIVMDALEMTRERKLFKKNVASGFLSWFESNPDDIGNQIYEAINYYKNHGEYIPRKEEKQGNGSLMRNLPTALYGSLEYCIEQSEITHPSNAVSRIITAHYNLVQLLLSEPYTPNQECTLMEPTGYIVNTWNNALFYLNKPSFEESIIGPVNDGGDSDTIASITGGLSGLRFGYKAIPTRWLEALRDDVTEKLDRFAEFLISDK